MAKRYDYRRQYKGMSIDELKRHMQYNNEMFNKYFVSVGGTEMANEYHKIYTYLKNRIEAESVKVQS
jgi:hypothetical protein